MAYAGGWSSLPIRPLCCDVGFNCTYLFNCTYPPAPARLFKLPRNRDPREGATSPSSLVGTQNAPVGIPHGCSGLRPCRRPLSLAEVQTGRFYHARALALCSARQRAPRKLEDQRSRFSAVHSTSGFSTPRCSSGARKIATSCGAGHCGGKYMLPRWIAARGWCQHACLKVAFAGGLRHTLPTPCQAGNYGPAAASGKRASPR
jgi:hypothetical protein